MGAESVFKRHKNSVYLTCCVVISLFAISCQSVAQFRVTPASVDRNEKKYLSNIQVLVLQKEFEPAEQENQRMLDYYNRLTTALDPVESNYMQNAVLISNLLTRIMDDKKEIQTLYEKIQMDEAQIKTMNLKSGSLKKHADTLEKKTADMNTLHKKIQQLENEKKQLQKQIDQLKEIDLKADQVIGIQEPVEKKEPEQKLIPLIDESL